MLRRYLPLALAAGIGAGVARLSAPQGVSDAAAWTFSSGALVARVSNGLAALVGDAPALDALAVVGGALSAAMLFEALRAPGREARAGLVTLVALLSAPVLTGAQSALPGAACLGPAALALAWWRDRPVAAAVLTALVGAWSAPVGVSLALAGALLTASLPPLVLAAGLAALGSAGAGDVTGAASFPWVREPATPVAGLALLGAALILPGDVRLRRVAGLAALLALGPVLRVQGQLLPMPAALPAALGSSGGWSAAGVVAAAALAHAAMGPAVPARLASPRAWVALALIVAEGLALGSRPVTPFPRHVPEMVRSLTEREGAVLVLPAGRLGERSARRGALWRHLAARFGRPLHAEGHPLASSDPALGATGVMALFAVLEPEEDWVLPPADEGKVLRALGVTELILDRAACTAEELASIDPVMARLFGPPQRDVAAGVDLWRVSPQGERSFPTEPYLRRAGEPGTMGWQGIERLLASPTAPSGPG